MKTSYHSKNLPRSKDLLLIISIGVVIFFVLPAVIINKLSLGVKGEWVWSYAPSLVYANLWIPCAIFFVFVYCIKKSFAWHRDIFVLAVLIVFGAVFQLGVGLIGPLGLYEYVPVTIIPMVSGFFTESLKIDNIFSFLRDYPALMSNFNFHASGYPPGPILYFWSISRFFEKVPFLADKLLVLVRNHLFDPDAVFIAQFEKDLQITLSLTTRASVIASSLLIPVIASLTLIPLYMLAKEIYNKKVGLTACALFMLVPSIILFAPGYDIVFPLFTVTSICFLYMGLKRQRYVYLFISGIVVCLGLFFSLNQLATLLLMGLIYLFYSLRKIRMSPGKKEEDLKALPNFAGFGVLSLISGILTMFLIYRVLLGINLFQILYICRLNNIVRFFSTCNRTYYKWIIFNMLDFSLFIGVAISIPLACKYFSDIRDFLKKKDFTLLDPLCLSFILLLAILNFSGQNLGETARLWIFLMPIAVLIASTKLAELDFLKGNAIPVILFYQFVQTIMFRLCICVHTLL